MTTATNLAGILQDIIANPDDDFPRLVYADALDDAGEYEHAEFIRLQLQLARPNPPGDGSLTGTTAWDRRERWLLLNRGQHWADGFDVALADLRRFEHAVLFHRGFPEGIGIPHDDWLARGWELAQRWPLRRVVLSDCSPLLHFQMGVYVVGSGPSGQASWLLRTEKTGEKVRPSTLALPLFWRVRDVGDLVAEENGRLVFRDADTAWNALSVACLAHANSSSPDVTPTD